MNTIRKSTDYTQNESGGIEFAHSKYISKDNFYYFLGEMYHNCKRFNIKPSFIIKWLQDLFKVNSILIEKSDHLQDYNSNNAAVLNKSTEFARIDTDKKGLDIERNDDHLGNSEYKYHLSLKSTAISNKKRSNQKNWLLVKRNYLKK